MNQTQEPAPAVRFARASTRYLLLGFLLSWLPLPASGLAAVPLIASFVYGVRAMRAAQRSGAGDPAASHIIGLALTALLVVMVVAPLAQYERTLDYQRCMWGANTQLAAEACQQEHDQHPGSISKFFSD